MAWSSSLESLDPSYALPNLFYLVGLLNSPLGLVLFVLECSYPIKLGLTHLGLPWIALSIVINGMPLFLSQAYGLLLRFPFPCVMRVYGRVTLPSRALTWHQTFNSIKKFIEWRGFFILFYSFLSCVDFRRGVLYRIVGGILVGWWRRMWGLDHKLRSIECARNDEFKSQVLIEFARSTNASVGSWEAPLVKLTNV